MIQYSAACGGTWTFPQATTNPSAPKVGSGTRSGARSRRELQRVVHQPTLFVLTGFVLCWLSRWYELGANGPNEFDFPLPAPIDEVRLVSSLSATGVALSAVQESLGGSFDSQRVVLRPLVAALSMSTLRFRRRSEGVGPPERISPSLKISDVQTACLGPRVELPVSLLFLEIENVCHAADRIAFDVSPLSSVWFMRVLSCFYCCLIIGRSCST